MDVGDPTGKASNVVVTIKVANLTTIPSGWRWSIRFGVVKNGTLVTAPPSGIPGDTSPSDYFVSMVSDGGASGGSPGGNSFTWGVTSTPNNAARLFTTKGAIDPSSNATPDGNITLVVPKSIIQNPGPGDTINITLASVRLGSPSGGTNETIPDSTGAGSYTLRATNLCLPNTAPIAVLTADVDEGLSPLTVHFDGGGSTDPDSIDTIASCTFNFGDGGDDVTQASPTISHVFNATGEYIVRLVVTDSRGKLSSNTAQLIVEVEQALGAGAVVSRKAHGTVGNFDIDLPFTGTAGLECRQPGSQSTYQLVYTFNKAVSVPGTATKAQGSAIVGTPTLGPNADQVTVPLRSVTDAQHLIINLSGVQDNLGEAANNQMARMDLLIGDVDASRRVDSTDVFQERQLSLQIANPSNFRADIDGSGRLDSTDVFITRQRSLNSLP
jgi:PKD repeat protein